MFSHSITTNTQWAQRLGISLACIFLLSLSGIGQGLDLIGRVKVESGSLSGAKVVILKEGKKVKTIKNGLAKFELRLDFNSTYVFAFEKEGYVTKRLQFNTGVPQSKQEKDFAPFAFTVSLFEQYDDVNIVVFNQPVGMINYESDLEEFDYDTDYTKSIQSQLDAAMKEIAQAKKRAEKQAKKEQKEKAAEEVLAQKAAAAEKKRKEKEALAANEKLEKQKPVESPEPLAKVESKPKERPKPVAPKLVMPDPDRAKLNTGEEGRREISVNEGFEHNPVKKAKVNTGSEKEPKVEKAKVSSERFEDTIVEKAKVITKVRFVTGDRTIEYLKVYHKWGGTFYFKNGENCSQNVYELETMGFDLMAMP